MAKKRLSPFVPLTWKLLKSEAYLALKPNSAKLLPFFLGKGKLKHALQEFTFSYTEAQTLGFARSTFKRVIKDLILNGFIKITKHGGLKGFEMSYSKYKLTDKWMVLKAVDSGYSIVQSNNEPREVHLQGSKMDL